MSSAWDNARRRGLDALQSRLEACEDVSGLYKAPTAFFVSGRLRQAHRVLDQIRDRHQHGLADTSNPVYMEYRPYMPGWIAMAAQRMGRFDLVRVLRPWLRDWRPSGWTDMLSTAHLGLAALYFGELDEAQVAGDKLIDFLQGQSAEEILLRRDDNGIPISEFSPEVAVFHAVRKDEEQQALFMLGYPAAFLSKLHDAAGRPQDLETARRYLDFALACKDVRRSQFSHKVAWAAALLSVQTGEIRYAEAARDIADYLVEIQGADGLWFGEQGFLFSLDQSAEICAWLIEIEALTRQLTA
jgi:hypothetical protein